MGEHLREKGLTLPRKVTLGEFVSAHPSVLTLSGPRNSRKVSITGRSVADVMAASVCAILDVHGDMTTAELKLRLSEQGRFVPGLATLLRRRNDTFAVAGGVVSLLNADVGRAAAATATPGAPLMRLLALDLSAAMDEPLLVAATTVRDAAAALAHTPKPPPLTNPRAWDRRPK